jgi:signal transduction histidine kinase
MNMTCVDLADLLRSVKQVASAWSPSTSSHVKLVLPPEPILIHGDYGLLHQAFTNLVRNACEAMPHGGTVTMAVESALEEGVAIAVSDTGIGLSEADVKRLGEPFFSKRPGGVGLGVSLARRIVSEHGGCLIAKSVLGQGTSVTIRLPSARPDRERQLAAESRHR